MSAAWWMRGLDAPLGRRWSETLPLGMALFFLLFVFQKVARHPEMFLRKHGRKHALTGLVYMLWITMGFVDLWKSFLPPWFLLLFHVTLGVLGTALAVSAAIEFQHKNVKNFASGTLDEHATVTYGEMVEHAYYQALNLLQIVYFHALGLGSGTDAAPALSLRLALLAAVTLPWYFRDRFPVNRFSDNYREVDARSSALVRALYRIKKYQYVFYKHFLLHGLNITVALSGASLAVDKPFRLYWLLLNTSYVMEFFLQTLVKKRFLEQQTMLHLQKLLMTASTLVAIVVLRHVSITIALASLALNFAHRGHDLLNCALVAGAATAALALSSPGA